MNALPPVLLFLPFIIMGMRLLRGALQSMLSRQIHKGLLEKKSSTISSLSTGVFGAFMLLSTSIYNRLILNLLQSRLISWDRALNLSLGSLLGSFLIALPFLFTSSVISLVIMLIGSLGVLWTTPGRVLYFSRALFGMGLVYCGLSLGQHFFSISSISLEPWLAFLAGIVFSLVLRSSAVALIVGLWVLSIGETVGPFMYGAGVLLGGSFPELLSSRKGSFEVRQLGFIVFSQRFMASTIGVSFALWLSQKEGSINRLDGLLFYGFIITGATILIFIFKKFLLNLAIKIFPNEEYPDSPKLDMNFNREETTPAISLIQARRQVGKMSDIVERIFVKVREYLSSESKPRVLAKIKNYEQITDNMKIEVEDYLMLVMQKPLSENETKEVRLLLRLISDLEAIADYLDKIATYRTRLEEEQKLPEDLKSEFFSLYDQVEAYFLEVIGTLGTPEDELRSRLDSQAYHLKKQLEQMREEHVLRLDRGDGPATLAMTYSDMVVALRKIRGHTRHISNALGL